MCGTTIELFSSHRGIVCPLAVALRIALGVVVVWEADSPTRRPLLPLNAGTAEPFRVSPPEAVAYHLELDRDLPSFDLAVPGALWYHVVGFSLVRR